MPALDPALRELVGLFERAPISWARQILEPSLGPDDNPIYIREHGQMQRFSELGHMRDLARIILHLQPLIPMLSVLASMHSDTSDFTTKLSNADLSGLDALSRKSQMQMVRQRLAEGRLLKAEGYDLLDDMMRAIEGDPTDE